jgi:hypothetical protein
MQPDRIEQDRAEKDPPELPDQLTPGWWVVFVVCLCAGVYGAYDLVRDELAPPQLPVLVHPERVL